MRTAKAAETPENNQWVADVFPTGLEPLLFGGFTGELWMEPGTEPTQGKCYRDPDACPPGVCGTLSSFIASLFIFIFPVKSSMY